MRAVLRGWAATLVFAASTGLAHAQTEGLELDYQSAFENYSAWKAIEGKRDWVGANQTVQQIGGWRYYVREPFLSQTQNSQSQPNQTGLKIIPNNEPAQVHPNRTGGQP